MEADYYGETMVGRVAQPNITALGNMTRLRDFLLEHIGDSISSIEELDVEPDQFNIVT
jgi:hypothetical protein